MLSRKLATLGLFGTLLLAGLSCDPPPPSPDNANVRITVQPLGSELHVVEVKLKVPETGAKVDVNAEARINGTGQAEVDLFFYVDDVLQDIDIPQIIVAPEDSGCIGCPEDTRGSGSYTWMSMTPGDYTADLPINWGVEPNASADISLTFDTKPGAEWMYVKPAEQIVSDPIIVAVKPINLAGPVTELELTVEFAPASPVDLLDEDGDGVYVNAVFVPGTAGDHDMTITITNTVTAAVTNITHTYTVLPEP